MPFMPSAFARLLEPLDRRVIGRVVREHGGDHGVGSGAKAWTCERHLKALLFAQFAGLQSLREIVAGLGARSASFYHLNLRAPCRSTLADANTERPAAVFRDIARALVPVAAGVLRRESEAVIRLLDATPLTPRPSRSRASGLPGPRRARAPAASNCTCSMIRGRIVRCGSS
jgi:hypothetical protein